MDILNVLDDINSKIKQFDKYFKDNSDSLVGYVMELGYEKGTIITNDYYKLRNNGIPKNSFLLIKLIDEMFDDKNIRGNIPNHLILARVIEPTTTPLSSENSKTYFELHKNHMPEIDIFTKAELQWSALKISIIGTYFDGENGLEFAGDIESYFSPHMYAVYVPSDEILTTLVNNNINKEKFTLGKLRYTESKLYKTVNVNVDVSVDDFVASRTALFGKTRMGKSNTVKIIAESIISTDKKVGQVIFDLNGEYANVNEQDSTSLYEKYKDHCERYSVNPKDGMKSLKVNMYDDLQLGLEILVSMLELENQKSDYINGFLKYEIMDKTELENLKGEDFGEYKRVLRKLSIYQCILKKSNFKTSKNRTVYFNIKKDILNAVGIE